MINTSTFTQVSYNFEVQDIMLSVNVFCEPKIRPWLEFVPDVASHVHVICAAADFHIGTLLRTNKAKTGFFGGKLEDLQVFFLLTKTGCFSREGRSFPAVLLPSKSRGLSREVGPSLDFLMAPKTGILSQTTMFSMFLCHNLTRA